MQTIKQYSNADELSLRCSFLHLYTEQVMVALAFCAIHCRHSTVNKPSVSIKSDSLWMLTFSIQNLQLCNLYGELHISLFIIKH